MPSARLGMLFGRRVVAKRLVAHRRLLGVGAAHLASARLVAFTRSLSPLSLSGDDDSASRTSKSAALGLDASGVATGESGAAGAGGIAVELTALSAGAAEGAGAVEAVVGGMRAFLPLSAIQLVGSSFLINATVADDALMQEVVKRALADRPTAPQWRRGSGGVMWARTVFGAATAPDGRRVGRSAARQLHGGARGAWRRHPT